MLCLSSSTPSSPTMIGCLFFSCSALPWSNTNNNNHNSSSNCNINTRNGRSSDSKKENRRQSSSSSSLMPPALLATPKSSNRSRACRQIANEYKYEDEYDYEGDINSRLLIVPPMQKQRQASHLDVTEATNNRTTRTTDSNSRSSNGPLSTPGAPISATRAEEEVSSSSSSRTRRNSSTSCHEFVNNDDAVTTVTTSTTTKLSKQRQEQLERRDRRSKFTVVQRSLTLAHRWNQKGLSVAGKATQVEAEAEAEAHAPLPALLEGCITRGKDHSPHEQQEQQEYLYGVWSQAFHCWNQSLQIYSSLLGKSHASVTEVQNNREFALGKMKHYTYAIQACNQAVTRRTSKSKERIP